MQPLVSALMATHDRRAFVPRAIECFLAQTYTRSELIILDDGIDDIYDLIPRDKRVRFYRAKARWELGRKNEWLCQLAAGDYFALWDDDDWHGPDRIARQLAALAAGGADACLLEKFVGYDLRNDRACVWNWRARGACADGTAMFTRGWYRSGAPYQIVKHPTQKLFKRDGGVHFTWIDAADLYVQVLHGENTSTSRLLGPGWIEATPEIAELARSRVAPSIGANAK